MYYIIIYTFIITQNKGVIFFFKIVFYFNINNMVKLNEMKREKKKK